jgi:hypothetical protein
MRYGPTLLSTLTFKHLDRPGIVMGGAPTLPDELQASLKAFPDPVLLSANEHGARLLGDEYAKEPDYFFCADERHQVCGDLMRDRCRRYSQAPIVSHRFVQDIRLNDFAWWGVHGNSGLLGALTLWIMGCSPVILAGFTNYAPEMGTYFHDPAAQSSGRTKPDGFFEDRCNLIAARTASRPTLRVPPGSVLSKYFPDYTVPVDKAEEPSALMYYRGKLPCWYMMLIGGPMAVIGAQQFAAQDLLLATKTEVKQHLKYGWVRQL